MGRYDLFKISDDIQDYAEAVSKIVNVEVEVVDRKFRRVAGTGYYKDIIGLDMSSKGYVYNHVFSTKELTIITNPGEHELCEHCPDRDNCVETFEISTPILLDGEVIGVLGLIGLDESARELLENNLENYLDFVVQITNFISAIMIKSFREEEDASHMEALSKIIEFLNDAVLVLDSDDSIRLINGSAKEQLGLTDDCIGMKVIHSQLEDQVGSGREYSIEVADEKKYVLGDILKLGHTNLNKLLVFDGIRKVKSDLYDMTSTFDRSSIIGSSVATKTLLKEIVQLSNSNSTVLITGESGTGKELIATSIWKNSSRGNSRFISINCAAIPETLLESELFGYTKGAFTGADSKGKIGKFELANNGIIFLDEIGDMPIYLQSKILRVLENRVVTRLGSNKEIPLDIRVIAATNKNLLKMIEEGRFREDLYYRLNVIPIRAVPLRERTEDIEDLTKFFIERYSSLFDKTFRRIDDEVINILMSHSWPGNVRELENVVEFMINMMKSDGVLNMETLPSEFTRKKISMEAGSIKTIPELEAKEIRKALTRIGRSTEDKRIVAETLDIGIATLYRKMKQYGIE